MGTVDRLMVLSVRWDIPARIGATRIAVGGTQDPASLFSAAHATAASGSGRPSIDS